MEGLITRHSPNVAHAISRLFDSNKDCKRGLSLEYPRFFHASRTKAFLTGVEIVDYGLIDGEGNRVVGIDDDF